MNIHDVIIRKDIDSHDNTIMEVNGWLKKKEYAFPNAKNKQCMNSLIYCYKLYKLSLLTWKNVLTCMFKK